MGFPRYSRCRNDRLNESEVLKFRSHLSRRSARHNAELGGALHHAAKKTDIQSAHGEPVIESENLEPVALHQMLNFTP